MGVPVGDDPVPGGVVVVGVVERCGLASIRARGPGSDQPPAIGVDAAADAAGTSDATVGASDPWRRGGRGCCWYSCSHVVWYWRGVSRLPAPARGRVSHSAESGSGRWPMYQTTGTAVTSPSWRSRIACDVLGGLGVLDVGRARRRRGGSRRSRSRCRRGTGRRPTRSSRGPGRCSCRRIRGCGSSRGSTRSVRVSAAARGERWRVAAGEHGGEQGDAEEQSEARGERRPSRRPNGSAAASVRTRVSGPASRSGCPLGGAPRLCGARSRGGSHVRTSRCADGRRQRSGGDRRRGERCRVMAAVAGAAVRGRRFRTRRPTGRRRAPSW